jgi:serine/threonine protein kinase
VLEGLAALEARDAVVALLNRLTVLLRGGLLDKAAFLHARKVAGLELERIADVFRAKQSHYLIERALGAGLFTAAYLARDEFTDLRVVVRVLRPEFAAQPLVRGHFLDLGRRSVHFVHQNLVLTRGVLPFPDRDLYCVVRDYVDGPTLREVLANGKRFEPRQVLEILRQLLEALTPLHRGGACHGGVRPTNVFLTGDGRVVLGDPSLPIPPAAAEAQRLAYDFRYAPPEMFRTGAALGSAADFYALGCVAHELCCGAPPFVSDSHYALIAMHDRDAVALPSAAGSVLGEAGDAFLCRLLAKAPAERFTDIAEAIGGLASLREERRPVPALPAAPAPAAAALPEASAVDLLREQSLAGYRDRQSLLSLGQAEEGTLLPGSGLSPDASVPPAAADKGAALPQIPGYEIEGELGRGAMGVVYKARHTALNRVVALKTIFPGSDAGPTDLVRFHTEAEAVARLHHPNIVQIYDVGERDGVSYLALEFAGGGTLQDTLHGDLLPPAAAARLVETLARAVQYAHERGIVHRDLKPSNILLGEGGTPKIADFGLAKRLDNPDPGATLVGQVLGTPTYMAPEQAAGDLAAIGPAADVYSLGAVLYKLLTGHPPFHGSSPHEFLRRKLSEAPPPPTQFRPEVPRDLDRICLKCLATDPTQRYPSATALAEDLRRYLEGGRVEARPAAAPARGKVGPLWQRESSPAPRRAMPGSPLPRRRLTAVAVLIAALLLAALAVLAWLFFSSRAGAAVTGQPRAHAAVRPARASPRPPQASCNGIPDPCPMPCPSAAPGSAG